MYSRYSRVFPVFPCIPCIPGYSPVFPCSRVFPVFPGIPVYPVFPCIPCIPVYSRCSRVFPCIPCIPMYSRVFPSTARPARPLSPEARYCGVAGCGCGVPGGMPLYTPGYAPWAYPGCTCGRPPGTPPPRTPPPRRNGPLGSIGLAGLAVARGPGPHVARVFPYLRSFWPGGQNRLQPVLSNRWIGSRAGPALAGPDVSDLECLGWRCGGAGSVDVGDGSGAVDAGSGSSVAGSGLSTDQAALDGVCRQK